MNEDLEYAQEVISSFNTFFGPHTSLYLKNKPSTYLRVMNESPYF